MYNSFRTPLFVTPLENDPVDRIKVPELFSKGNRWAMVEYRW